MNKYVAFKPNVGTVTVATEPGSILQFDHEIYFNEGEYIFTGLDGKQHIIPDNMINSYIEVEVKQKEIDKEAMANAYASMNEWMTESVEKDIYINGTKKISKDKF